MESSMKSCTKILCLCAAMSGGFLVYKLYEKQYNSRSEAAKRKCLTPAEFPRLPPEIVTDILSYFSVKSFLRLRCVLKQLNALMDDRQFTRMFMERKTKTYAINNFGPTSKSLYKCYIATCDGLDLILLTSVDYDHCCCCSSRTKRSLLIRNKALRQKLHLPKPYDEDLHRGIAYGFTFIPSTSEYKVVSIYLEDRMERCSVITLRGSKHRWRPLDLPRSKNKELENDVTRVIQAGVNLHCIRTVKEESLSSYYEVRSLDMESECFTVTKVYKEFIGEEKEQWAMKWNEFLAFAYIDQHYELNVLVLEDYKKQKWGNKLTVSLPFMEEKRNRKTKLVPFHAEHGLVWFCMNDKKNIAFDLATKRIVHTISPKDNKTVSELEIYCRIQSLVTLEGMQFDDEFFQQLYPGSETQFDEKFCSSYIQVQKP